MNELDPEPEKQDFFKRAEAEIKAMAKEGWSHPSTQPVLIGAAIGFAVGLTVFDGASVLGLFVGAAIALYLRLEK